MKPVNEQQTPRKQIVAFVFIRCYKSFKNMGNLNERVSKTWDKQKFRDRQKRIRRYRLLNKLKANLLFRWWAIKDIFNCL